MKRKFFAVHCCLSVPGWYCANNCPFDLLLYCRTNGQYDPGERPLNDFGIGINDIEGPITEDYYGNDLLSLVTDENGMLEVPNMWPQRYDIDVGPPPQSGWIKTNTLEGGHGWDYWLYEGWDGYEFVIGNEKFPFMVAGFVKVFNDLDPVASTVELSGTIKTVSPWPSGINFAEVTNLNQVCRSWSNSIRRPVMVGSTFAHVYCFNLTF